MSSRNGHRLDELPALCRAVLDDLPNVGSVRRNDLPAFTRFVFNDLPALQALVFELLSDVLCGGLNNRLGDLPGIRCCVLGKLPAKIAEGCERLQRVVKVVGGNIETLPQGLIVIFHHLIDGLEESIRLLLLIDVLGEMKLRYVVDRLLETMALVQHLVNVQVCTLRVRQFAVANVWLEWLVRQQRLLGLVRLVDGLPLLEVGLQLLREPRLRRSISDE